jgi:hypothetical protein
MKHLAVIAMLFAGCIEITDSSWSERLENSDLSMLHEHDATGDWVTVTDARGTEVCMFSAPNEPLDYAFVSHVCGWDQ